MVSIQHTCNVDLGLGQVPFGFSMAYDKEGLLEGWRILNKCPTQSYGEIGVLLFACTLKYISM